MATSPLSSSVIALWLLPREPAATFCRQTIERLARQYDAPVFVPHLTLGVVDDPPRSLENTLREAIQLRPCGVFWSPFYTKTLFVRFQMTPALQTLRQSLGLGGQYDPHLSLLYHDLPAEEKARLASSLKLSFPIAEFDRPVAVRCANPTTSRADIEAWQTLLKDV